MSLLRRKSVEETAPDPAPAPAPVAGKGHPTPKRREAEGRRGPVPPPPSTQREASKRARATESKLTKDERRVLAAERRERMMRGEDAYLLPRDKGPVRAYVRDMVDARRNIAGLLLPIAVLSFLVLMVRVPFLQAYGPLILLIAIIAAVVDMTIFTRQIAVKVRRQFPKGDPTGTTIRTTSLGFYAFNRAMLIRKWRAPRPRVKRGEIVD